jgi:hypothetical protein
VLIIYLIISKADKPSIADLSAFSELEQMILMNYEFPPKVEEWRNRLKKLQHYEDVHKILNTVKSKL